MKKLTATTITALLFMSTEIYGGLLSNSLAVLADAAHQLSDVAGFLFSILGIYVSQNPQYFGKTFGKSRGDTIGALVTILIIWVLVALLIYEAVWRIIHIDQIEIDGKLMLITACIGLFFNMINMFVIECLFNPEKEKKTEDTDPERQ